jgi:pimeloyl-ACP methyl ester carboxylesterase
MCNLKFMIHRVLCVCAFAWIFLAASPSEKAFGQNPPGKPNDHSQPGNLSRPDDSGVITLLARDATTHSAMMRYESQTNKNCLGYWTNPADWASWEFEVAHPGYFQVEVWQGCGKGQGGSDVAVEVEGKRFDFVVEETGHFQIFLPRKIWIVSFPATGKFSLALKPQRKQAGAIMDVRQVRLVPVKEGASVLQLPGKRSRWFGFERVDFEVDGKSVLVIAPKVEAPGRPWAWHGEFFGHKPNPDLALLGRGFHIVYMSVPDMLGSPEAVAHWNALYSELTGQFGFAPKVALVGLSRGGLYCYNWAEANPNKVACIYGDAPVCDFKSWPGGFGKGKRSDRDWQLVLERYGFKTDDEAKAYGKNPVDNLTPLARAKVPLLHVFGDADEVVPWEENTGLVAERYGKLGGTIKLIRKPGVNHHPHGLDDSTPIVDFIWQNSASQAAKMWLAKHGGGPLDAEERPLIRKLGTIDCDLVETTPIVLNGRLWRFEWVRQGAGQQYWGNLRHTNYFRFRDPATGETTADFADGHEFGSAFVEGNTVYVTGTKGRSRVNMFASHDLKTWESWPVINDGRYGIFNTSLCKANKEFVLMFEIDKPVEEAGNPFTARFAKSPDLRHWTITTAECNYSKDRYTAPHALRWLNGWYYDFYLEAKNGYEMRLVRSRDLIHWEPSPLNPILRASPEDKLISNATINDAQRTRIANAVNLNNSDIDFCEWQGRLAINYSWGNQLGTEHLAEAVYDGSLEQFLNGWFPEKSGN